MYRPANMDAYQCGNAANVAPAAVMSQTSLPSQTGPMVLSNTRRCDSFLAHAFINMPTPRSKPSRMRYPVHSTAMRMNHNVVRNYIRVFYFSDVDVASISISSILRWYEGSAVCHCYATMESD